MKIAVLGSAASVARAPFQNDQYWQWAQGKAREITRSHDEIQGEFDIWGCSPGCWSVAPRATRWFEVHRWELNVPWFSPEYRQFLRDFKGPVYTGGRVDEMPNHVVFPTDYIEEKFSSYFLTSSLALMMALAIDTIEKVRMCRGIFQEWKKHVEANPHEVPNPPRFNLPNDMGEAQFRAELEKTDFDDVIGLWGVDMAANDEYAYQRPGCQFFCLEAGRRGIGVYLPPESDLMRPMPVYGVSEWDHNYIKLTSRARELNSRLTEQTAAVANSNQQIAGLQGELHALNYFVNTWTSPYGMLHGLVNRQDGEGMGSGITSLDTRPVTRMTIGEPHNVLKAMTEPVPEDPNVRLAKDLVATLMPHAGEAGVIEGSVECLRRIIGERDAAISQLQRPAKKAKRRR